jgi:hypothetical protein
MFLSVKETKILVQIDYSLENKKEQRDEPMKIMPMHDIIRSRMIITSAYFLSFLFVCLSFSVNENNKREDVYVMVLYDEQNTIELKK